MITRKMEDKFEGLKNYFDKKLSSQEQSLTCTFNALINDLKVETTKERKSEVSKQHEKLVSQNKMFQQHVSELRKLNFDNQAKNEELEQFGRRLCLHIDGISLKNNETREDVLDSIKNVFELADVNIPDMVVYCAHRIGCVYKDRTSNKKLKYNQFCY